MSTTRAPFVVLGFSTTHAALAAEALLRDAGVDVVPVPTPQSIGGTCGIAMRVPPEQAVLARELLGTADISPSGETEIQDLVRG